MMGNETEEIIGRTFWFFFEKTQKNWEESMRGSEFVFYSVNSLYYKLHKISLNGGKSYIDSHKWLKKEKGNNKS